MCPERVALRPGAVAHTAGEKTVRSVPPIPFRLSRFARPVLPVPFRRARFSVRNGPRWNAGAAPGGICGLLRLLPVRFVLSGAVSAPSQAGSGWKSGTAPGGICGLLRLLPVRFVLSGAVSASSQTGSGWKSGTAPGGICGFCGRPIAVRPALRMRNRRDLPRGPACRRVVSFAAAYSAAAASASSTRIRPQYSQTMIFLLWRISICRWGGMRLKQPPQASRLTVTTASPLRTLRRIRS